MIRAPSRYARIVRVLVPFAAVCGLGYIFLTTFAPAHFGPEASLEHQPMQERKQPTSLQQHHAPPQQYQVQNQERQDTHPIKLEGDEGGSERKDLSDSDTNGIDGRYSPEFTPGDDGQRIFQGKDEAFRYQQLYKDVQVPGDQDPIYEVIKANGVLVMLINENQLQDARRTIRHLEDRFNRGRNYPWIIFTAIPLQDRSRESLFSLTKGSMSFALIQKDHWHLPKWIDMPKVIEQDFEMMLKKAINRTSMPIRHQWRFQSGFLALHELLDPYEFFWRVDPGVDIFCDMREDPMLAMKKNGQKFAWSSTTTVYGAGVPSAFSTIQAFKETHAKLIPKSNDEAFVIRESGDEFTTCSYALENSISRVDFFRSEAYQTLFNTIDQAGLFYYEKWTDSTVISIALALLATRSETLYLKQLGWGLNKLSYCPRTPDINRHCHCDPLTVLSPLHVSCTPFWMGLTKSPRRVERLECRPDGKCKLYIGGDGGKDSTSKGILADENEDEEEDTEEEEDEENVNIKVASPPNDNPQDGEYHHPTAAQ